MEFLLFEKKFVQNKLLKSINRIFRMKFVEIVLKFCLIFYGYAQQGHRSHIVTALICIAGCCCARCVLMNQIDTQVNTFRAYCHDVLFLDDLSSPTICALGFVFLVSVTM